jgi:hypothetical protein
VRLLVLRRDVRPGGRSSAVQRRRGTEAAGQALDHLRDGQHAEVVPAPGDDLEAGDDRRLKPSATTTGSLTVLL